MLVSAAGLGAAGRFTRSIGARGNVISRTCRRRLGGQARGCAEQQEPCSSDSWDTLVGTQSAAGDKASRSAGRGALIVFEGLDRCGKTTQAGRLRSYLRSVSERAECHRFPDRSTPVGQVINRYLRKELDLDPAAAHRLFVANRWERRSAIIDKLQGGTTLVLDRYSYSGVAYSAAKGLPGLGADYCRSLEEGLPAADLVVYMKATPELSAARGGYGGERYEEVDFQHKVREQYALLHDSRWADICAAQDIDTIFTQVREHALGVVKLCSEGAPLCRLWDYSPIQVEVPPPGFVLELLEQPRSQRS